VPEDEKVAEKVTVNLRLHRDADGGIHPIEGVSPNLGIEVEVLPLTYGASRKLKSFGDALFDWSDEDRVYVLNNHLKVPDMQLAGVEDLQDNFDGWVIEDLLQAVFIYSGMARLYDPEIEGNEVGEDSPEESNSQ